MDLGGLNLLTVVGQGAFGTVFLSKYAATNKYYAVKMLKKNKLIKGGENSINYAKFEINVMKEMQHPRILGISFVV
jgi:serine/threonine protein kinase